MADMPPTIGPRRAVRDREADQRRRRENPWRAWYGLRIWQIIRERELGQEPLCARCGALGLLVPATVVDHSGGHGGDWSRFVNGPFETMCKTHHDAVVQAEERAASGQGR